MSKKPAKILLPQSWRGVLGVIAASNDNWPDAGRPEARRARPRLACHRSDYRSPDQRRSSAVTAVLVHEVRGRMRFVASALKGNHAQAAALCERLLATRLVQTARFNPVTGSVVVTYDPLVVTRGVVLLALSELGFSAILSMQFSDVDHERDFRAAAFVAKAALHFILDHALESAVVAIL